MYLTRVPHLLEKLIEKSENEDLDFGKEDNPESLEETSNASDNTGEFQQGLGYSSSVANEELVPDSKK